LMIINRPAEFSKKKTNVRKKVGRTAVMLELWTALCAAIICVSSSVVTVDALLGR
jgi:hypothetical protein